MNRIIKKVALAVFKNKKVIMVRSVNQKEVFYSLGGKIKEGESEIDCLKREVWEEVGCKIDEQSLKFLTELKDVAHGKDRSILHMRIYKGKLVGDPKPSSEVVEVRFFDSSVDKKHLSTFAQRTLFPWLKMHGYIN